MTRRPSHLARRRAEVRNRRPPRLPPALPRPDQCVWTGKVQYASPAAAEVDLASLERISLEPEILDIYRCRCGGWHIGHNPRLR